MHITAFAVYPALVSKMKSLKLPAFLLITGLTLGSIGTTYLNYLYSRTRPTSPKPVEGLVYEHIGFRGSAPVYISRTESWLYVGAWAGGFLLALSGGVLWQRANRHGSA